MTIHRPTYETAEHLAAEAKVAVEIGRRWQCEAVKLPVQYRVDYALVRAGAVVSWMEVKARSVSMRQIAGWGGYLLSLAKWTAGAELIRGTGRPFTLAVHATDGLFAAVVTEPGTPGVHIGGRRDRADWQDREPVVLIPVETFRRLR